MHAAVVVALAGSCHKRQTLIDGTVVVVVVLVFLVIVVSIVCVSWRFYFSNWIRSDRRVNHERRNLIFVKSSFI